LNGEKRGSEPEDSDEHAEAKFERHKREVFERAAEREALHPLGRPFTVSRINVNLIVTPASKTQPLGGVTVHGSSREGTWVAELAHRATRIGRDLEEHGAARAVSFFVSHDPDVTSSEVATALSRDPELATILEIDEAALDEDELVFKTLFMIPDLATAVALAKAIERGGAAVGLKVEDWA
jgi:hypothetical protein